MALVAASGSSQGNSHTEEPATSRSLLDLPIELRYLIYDEALLSHLPKSFVAKPNFAATCHYQCKMDGPKLRATALFRVCRAVHLEATRYFYSHLQFEISDKPYCTRQQRYFARDASAFHACTLIDFKPFLLSIGVLNCAGIRKLRINISRDRFVQDPHHRGAACNGSHFLANALKLLSPSNNLSSLEIHFQSCVLFDTMHSCDTIMQQLRKFNGIQKVKIVYPSDWLMGAQKRISDAKKQLEGDLKASPDQSTSETYALLGDDDSSASPSVRKAQKLGKEIIRLLDDRKELETQCRLVSDHIGALDMGRTALEGSLKQLHTKKAKVDEQLEALGV